MNRQRLFAALGIAAFAFGVFLLYRVFKRYDFREIISILGTADGGSIGLALSLAMCSYTCVAALEVLAVTYTGQAVPLPRIVSTGIAAVSIGRSIGFAALSSGAVRYRMYGRAGLHLFSVGAIVVFSGVSVALGFAVVGGGLLLWRGDLLAPFLGLSPAGIRNLAIGLLIAATAYILLCALRRKPVRLRRNCLRIPRLRLAVGQVILSSLNLTCIGGVLYIALRSFTDVGYPLAAMLYFGSDLAAVIGHVPGGWDVLEYIVTSVLAGGQVLSGVIVFRATYYLIPLGAGLLIFLADEWRHRRIAQTPSRGRHIPAADHPGGGRP